MKIYRTKRGPVVEDRGRVCGLYDTGWDELFNRPDLLGSLTSLTRKLKPLTNFKLSESIIAPIAQQEVWAAGVTYFRSREARIEESKDAGGGDFYDRVYNAERPELFFKATPHRVAGPGAGVRIREDSKWNVPEPELALAVSRNREIIGFTIGNDMSSRDIEGENPLYLPQAKLYDQCCGLGPGILVTDQPLPATTKIELRIRRGGNDIFSGETQLSSLKRRPEELVSYLFRDNSFPHGCFLLTGTGIVPPDDFTLHSRDQINITIAAIGTLTNVVM